MSRSVDPQSAVPISIPLPTSDSFLTIFPLRRANAPAELVAFLAATFNAVVAAGRTYPHLQEHSLDEFADYFFRTRFAPSFPLRAFVLSPGSALSGFASRSQELSEKIDLVAFLETEEDCFVGLQESGVETAGLTPLKEGGFLRETNLSIDSVLAGRSWQSVTLGFFCESLSPRDCPPRHCLSATVKFLRLVKLRFSKFTRLRF